MTQVIRCQAWMVRAQGNCHKAVVTVGRWRGRRHARRSRPGNAAARSVPVAVEGRGAPPNVRCARPSRARRGESEPTDGRGSVSGVPQGDGELALVSATSLSLQEARVTPTPPDRAGRRTRRVWVVERRWTTNEPWRPALTMSLRLAVFETRAEARRCVYSGNVGFGAQTRIVTYGPR